MATLYITEFRGIGVDGTNHTVQIAQQPPEAEQTLAIGGASAQSAQLNDRTTMVRVHCDVICSIAVGANPTASAANARMLSGQTEYFAVPRQSGFKIAVISNV
jgi:hypothetical protein